MVFVNGRVKSGIDHVTPDTAEHNQVIKPQFFKYINIYILRIVNVNVNYNHRKKKYNVSITVSAGRFDLLV